MSQQPPRTSRVSHPARRRRSVVMNADQTPPESTDQTIMPTENESTLPIFLQDDFTSTVVIPEDELLEVPSAFEEETSSTPPSTPSELSGQQQVEQEAKPSDRPLGMLRRDRQDNRRNRRGQQQGGQNGNANAHGNAGRAEPEPAPLAGQLFQISELRNKSAAELIQIADSMGLENTSRTKKQEVIFNIVRTWLKQGADVMGDGVLDLHNEGYGFLRSSDNSYQPGSDDVYLSSSQIRRFNLRTGDTISGRLRMPKESERFLALAKVDSVNFEPPENSRKKVVFENLTPLFPDERFTLEQGNGSTEDISARIIDLIAPLGQGQRGLIVAPPKAGKTIILQNIAHSIAQNFPDVYLIVLLIDERPEEVTEMQRSVRGEVVASTFDEPAARHIQVAEMVIEKAKRLVEHKRNVVILLDSITRLARAYNTVTPASGKILSGGVDANALQKPKRFFGAARNVEEGGSLTILATALIDTGSTMDVVIYEEFKGTGNLELHLDRRIAEKRVYPAINVNKSGTRREDLLLDSNELQKVWILRKLLHPMDEVAAIELLMDRMKQTKTNVDFFDSMRRM